VAGIVLAAGLSTRSGRYKMALPLGGVTVIERSVGGMLPFVDRVLVVVGWQADRVRELLAGYERVELVYNGRYREGMLSSVKRGVERVSAPRFFLLPGDIPLVAPAVYAKLLAASGEVVLPAFQGQTGHPVLLSAGTIPEILALPADATLRDVIGRKERIIVPVEDDQILIDLDTPEDYERLQERYEASSLAE
jgi:molybdenum cofactor cytidylyltransferase